MTQIMPYRWRNGTTRPNNKENVTPQLEIMPPKPKETPIQKATWVT
jgi:hypothetical protein